MPESSKFLRPEDLARRWMVSTKTLANKRVRGEGPPYVKIGGAVRYRLTDIEAVEAASTVEAVA